ncbi:MAG: four helix bundle protein [Sediminibacterium sp.]
MATITRLEEIEIWRLARGYAKGINQVLKTDPFRYEFGLKEQMKNSSGSIMDNVAEGFGRGSKNEFVNFLTIAKGSAEESRSQLYRCFDCDLIDQIKHSELNEQAEIIVKKISSFILYLNSVSIKGQKFKDRI